MSSFYGNGVIVSGSGGGGTTNYNELDNKPITNLTGILPIDFSLLEIGVYNVKGNYKYSSDEETHTWLNSNIVQVFEDTVTGHKILRFDVYENDKRYTQTIIYNEDGSFAQEKFSYDVIQASVSSQLPETGDTSKIYSTEDGVYVYTEDGGYQKLGESFKWESL